MQDIGSARGPSNSLLSAGIPLSAWHSVGGGEAGHVACDPKDDDVVYAGEYMGYVSRYDFRTRQAKSIGVYPYNASGRGGEELKYRFQWTAPIVVSLHTPRRVYHAANVLLMTDNAGRKWDVISDDLTYNDKKKQKWSGGPITGDNTGVEVYGTIFAVTESPKEKDLLWAGTDDGRVWLARGGGKARKWQEVTAALKKAGMREGATVCCIEASREDAATCYVVADAHKDDNRDPYLFVTSDLGKTWKSLTGDKFPDLGYLQVVRVDPTDRKLLYVGGERGLAFSRDGGKSWQRLKLNLPTVRVTDLHVKGDDLVVGTNGRSIWIFDDLTPLRTPPAEWGVLLKVRPAVRYRYESPVSERRAPGNFPNPPAGALIHYHLTAKAKQVTLEILDGKDVIRTMTSKKLFDPDPDQGAYSEIKLPTPLPTEPGAHRIVWDLRHKGAFTIAGGRVDGGRPDIGPLVSPGTYTVRLTVDDRKPFEQTVEVQPDPRLKGKLEKDELAEQLDFARKVRDSITRLAVAVEELRGVRKQLLDRNKLLEGNDKAKALVAATKALSKKLDELEGRLHNPKAETSYDILAQRGGAKLYSQLAWLFELVKESDGSPTQGLLTVYKEQADLLQDEVKKWAKLKENDLADLNAAAKKLDLPTVLVPKIQPPPTDARPNQTRKPKRYAR
jgi:hypothetical protein